MAALDVHVDLWIDAAWVDITDDVYTRAPIMITRGRTAEGGQVEPSSCTVTVNNRDGTYSPRNPSSPYFGKIGRNTPARVRVTADVRLVGEISEWPTKWDQPGKDVYVALEVAGIMRRLGQGNAAAPSTPRTFILANDPAAYWPLEDGPLSVSAASAVSGGPVQITGKPAPDQPSPQVWGQGQLAPWLRPVAKIEHDTLGTVMTAGVAMSGFVDTWTIECIRSGGYGEGAGDGTLFSAVYGAATVETFVIVGFDAQAVDVTLSLGFSTVATATAPAGFWDDNPHHVRLTATQDGADIDYQVWIDGVSVLTHTETSETLAPLLRVATTVSTTVTTALATGHWAAWTDPPALADSVDAAFGHTGETAGRRIERICTEQGIPFTAVGDLDDTAPMGPQAPLPPLELLLEAAAADHGILYETRDELGLEYRTRTDLYDQTPALTADYSAGVFYGLPEPVDDDRATRNDVTTTRPQSGEARAVLEAGALSTADPPDGVGTYATSVTLNVAGDGFLADHAGWLLALGTVDEARYPRLLFRLNAAAGIAAAIAALDLGDLVRITDLPAWLPPDDVDALVQGTVETLGSHMRDIELATAPASPYNVAVYDTDRYDTAGSELDIGVNSTHTALAVEVTVEPLWTTDDAETPFDIYVGGERMTVTDIAAAVLGVHVFTVTRSVNGVVKAHDAGTPVRLWTPARLAL
jgi:hypothetical protein